MTLSVAEIIARMNREYTIFEIESDLKTDIIRLSVICLVDKLAIPIVATTIILIPDQLIYTVPILLRYDKLVDIRDSSAKSMDFSIDKSTGSIVFKSIPENTSTCIVYGLPIVSPANLEIIINAIPESVEDILSLYIDYWVHQKRKDASAPTLLQIAESMAQKKKRFIDNRLDIDYARATLMNSIDPTVAEVTQRIPNLNEGF